MSIATPRDGSSTGWGAAPGRAFGLEVLGCNATAPNEHGPASGYVLHGDDGVILVDAGPGTMAAFTAKYRPEDIRAIVVTHLHADHSLDLMAWAYRWTFPRVLASIPLFVPSGSEPALADLDAVYGIPTLPTMHAPISQSFEITPLEMDGTSRHRLAGWSLTAHEARHAVPSAALRFERGGRTVTFSSDTGDCDGLRAAAAGADLFVCEATWIAEPDPESAEHGHLTAAQAGAIAEASRVETLLLTHLADRAYAEETVGLAAAEFSGSTLLAHAGAVL